MAICDLCGNEMTTGASCVVGYLHSDDRSYELLPHHPATGPGAHPRSCGDCGVAPGGLHHIGCDLQACPRCGWQLISCRCRFDELANDYGHHDDAREGDAAWFARAMGHATAAPAFPTGDLPFDAAAAPLRAQHRWALDELAGRLLPSGAPIDLGVAALIVELLVVRRAAGSMPATAGSVVLRRPHVHQLLRGGISRWCWPQGVPSPHGVPEHTWAAIEWLVTSGRLSSESDPVAALLEPLQCTGGLDPTGRPRSAADAWPTLHCQCELPFNRRVPPGQIARAMGWELECPAVEYVHPPALDGCDAAADFEPLWRLTERLTQQFADDRTTLIVAPREWRFVGRSDPRGNDPALWFYRHGHAARHQIALPLDAGGRVYRAKVDRRRARGHRWERAHEAQLIAAAPLDAVTVWSERPFGRRANPTPRR